RRALRRDPRRAGPDRRRATGARRSAPIARRGPPAPGRPGPPRRAARQWTADGFSSGRPTTGAAARSVASRGAPDRVKWTSVEEMRLGPCWRTVGVALTGDLDSHGLERFTDGLRTR